MRIYGKEVRELEDIEKEIDHEECCEQIDPLVEEYQDVKRRYEHLKEFCNKLEACEKHGIGLVESACPLSLLREQQSAMGQYLHVLEIRAVVEHVIL